MRARPAPGTAPRRPRPSPPTRRSQAGPASPASGPCGPRESEAPRRRSGPLLDPDLIARGIAEGAVAGAVRLLGGLLDDLGVTGLDPLEGAVEVLGRQQDPAVGALRHHLLDGAPLVLGDTRVG